MVQDLGGWKRCSRQRLFEKGMIVQLKYNNSLDDVVALLKLQLESNDGYMKKRFWHMIGSPFVIFLLFSVAALVTKNLDYLLAGLAAAAVSHIWYRRVYSRNPSKAADTMLEAGELEGIIGSHSIEITTAGVSEQRGDEAALLPWASVVGVANTAGCIYLFKDTGIAYIIPQRDLGAEMFRQAAEEIETLREKSGEGSPDAEQTEQVTIV